MPKECQEKNCTKQADIDCVITPSATASMTGAKLKTVWLCNEHYEQLMCEVMAGQHWHNIGHISTKL